MSFRSSLKVATLQMKIISEDQAVETRTSELLFEWEKGKPVQGSVRPDVALNNLAIYEGKFSRLKEDRDNVARAKEALELMEPGLFLVIILFSYLFVYLEVISEMFHFSSILHGLIRTYKLTNDLTSVAS